MTGNNSARVRARYGGVELSDDEVQAMISTGIPSVNHTEHDFLQQLMVICRGPQRSQASSGNAQVNQESLPGYLQVGRNLSLGQIRAREGPP